MNKKLQPSARSPVLTALSQLLALDEFGRSDSRNGDVLNGAESKVVRLT